MSPRMGNAGGERTPRAAPGTIPEGAGALLSTPAGGLVQVVTDGRNRVGLEVGPGRERGQGALDANPHAGLGLLEGNPGVERVGGPDALEVDVAEFTLL